jgi:hypothetical protein
LIDLVSDTINRNYFCSELKVAVTYMAATFFFRRPRMLTSRQVIKNFYSKNRYILGASAMALASLLVIAPFNNGTDVRVTRESAIGLFLGFAAMGKWFDVATEA